MMKKLLAAALTLFAAALIVLFVNQRETPLESDSNNTAELVILHTNDHHGSLYNRDGHGGVSVRAALVEKLRQENPDALLLDAGDINTGMAESNMFLAQPDIIAYNRMRYDAVAVGNHEFDLSQTQFESQRKSAQFPFVCANVRDKSAKELVVNPYIVKEVNGVRVGIFGLLIKQESLLSGDSMYIAIDSEIETARKMVSLLREKEKAKVVIALTHLGNKTLFDGHVTSVDLGNQVEGLDLIIDGHAHTHLDKPIFARFAPVVTANAYGRYIGKAVLTVSPAGVKLKDWSCLPITDSLPQDAELSAELLPFKQRSDKELSTVIARASEKFVLNEKQSRYGEHPLCDLVCDSVCRYQRQKNAPVDFSIQNGGVFRCGLPAGNITKGDIKTALPFENSIVLFSLKGTDVIRLFDFIGGIYQSAGGFGQVSKEIRYAITYENGKNGKISDLTFNGKPIDPEKTYRIATNSYIFSGGDGYDFSAAQDVVDTAVMIDDAVIEILPLLPQPLVPQTDGRIIVMGGIQAE